MSNDRRVAVGILNTAAKMVGTERGPQHGDVAESFQAIAEAWSVYINAAITRRTGIAPVPPIHLDARDVLWMMADVKRYRAVIGDPHHADNYIDGAGYISLAGMLMTDLTPKEQAVDKAAEEAAQQIAEAAIPAFLAEKKK